MTRNQIVAVVIAVVCTALPLAGQFYGDHSGGWLMIDFRAYYCAASASAHHANPYFAESLHPCESSPVSPFYHAAPNLTVPAPYPPYVFAMLYPLTLLPFATAAVLWWVVLGLFVAFTAYALARVARQPFLVAWATLALSLGLTALPSGNMVVVCVAALITAALCAQQGYFALAALAITLAAVEPQLALPAAVAAFARFRESRLVLLCLFALLALASLVTSGLSRTIEYVTAVLPAHALAEVSRDNQYSLSTVLSALGAPDTQAVLIGGISYVLFALVGIIVGTKLSRRYHDPALALLIPPAFALIGGTFVHTAEFAIAVPACLLLLARARTRRMIVLTGLVLLSVPWMLATSISMLLAPLFPVAFLVYVLGGRDRTAALAAAAASLVGILLLLSMWLHSPTPTLAQHIVRPQIDIRLAEASWRTFVLGNSTNRPVMWLLRLPTWLGIIIFAGASLALLQRQSLAEAT